MYILLHLFACSESYEPTHQAVTSAEIPNETPCATPPPDTLPTANGPFSLSIEGGFGGGSYAEGETAHVWADVGAPSVLQGQIIIGWGTDESLLETPDEWNSALVMPARDVSLTVAVEAFDLAVSSRSVALAGGDREIRLVDRAPSSGVHLGIVLFFHGAAYSIEQINDAAAAVIARHLVRAGLLVVAVPSEAEASAGTGGWNAALDMGSNLDLQNVAALVDALRADGTIGEGLPIFAWGMSSGGYFAHTVGASGLVSAVVSHCAPGNADALAITTVPTAWYLAESDTVIPTGADDAQVFCDALTKRGIATDLYIHPQTPLYDARFTRIEGIDLAKSTEIAASLRASGAVDGSGRWLQPGSAIDVDVPGIEGELLTAVSAEIEIMAADHELYDDVAARMATFLAQQLPAGR